LSKLQKTEHGTLKNLHKAQEKHDVALAKLHKAEQDLEVRAIAFIRISQSVPDIRYTTAIKLSKRNHAQLQGAVQSKNANVEGVMKQQEENAVRNVFYFPALQD
jgi:ethanolamine ammonia-lyase small subunit